MKEMFDFIDDACNALDLLSRYYRIDYDKSKEIYNKDGVMVDDGIIEELGWSDRDIYNIIKKEDGSKFTFDDACESLTTKYEEITDEYDEENVHDGAYFVSLLELQFLNIDEIKRIALIRKIVRSSFIFLIPKNYPLYEVIQPCNTVGIFSYRDDDMSDAEIEDYEQKLGIHKSFHIISWLIDEYCNFLYGLGTLCSDYNIDLQDIVVNVFHVTKEDMPFRLDVFGDDILPKKGDEILNKKNEKNIASANMRYDVIRALLKASGWKGADNTKIAGFMGWLTGSSKQYFRTYILTGEKRTESKIKEDNDLISEKFKDIGMKYDKGEIKND